MQYIGLDLHAKSFSMWVLDADGQFLWTQTAGTSGENLVRLVSTLAGGKRVALEESTMADWAYRLLQPHAKVIVADPRHNRWIAGDEKIDDETAARKLAELLKAGLLKPVHHSSSAERQAFKELVQAYHDQSKQITRYKNKLKAKFRRRGISCSGSAVYGEHDREAWLAKLPGEGARIQVQLLWDTLDHLVAQQQQLRREIVRLGKQFPQIARFQKLPGVGLIRAATFFAFVDTPHRFGTKGKLWAYCSLGLAKAQSGETCGPEHLTYFGNRVLKDALKGAALSAIRAADNPFADKYRRLLQDKLAPELARLSVARSIATTLWALWRKDEDYQPCRPTSWQQPSNSNSNSNSHSNNHSNSFSE